MKVEDAIKHYGGAVHLASALNVSLQTIYNWREQGSIPFSRQCEIEIITDGKLKVESRKKKKR